MKLVRENINEKFTEDSDPIDDLGIGMKHQIKKWLETKSYDDNEKNLLWLCAINGKTKFVKYLLDAGADVHYFDDYALQQACYYGHFEIVKILLDAGADVHTDNNQALRWASDEGYSDIVKLLLNAGADVHALSDCALRYARDFRHFDVVKILKDHITKEKRKKKIKESLNEKFTEDSDPITDMGIGGFSYRTLKPGAIIRPKKWMRFGTNSGTLISTGGNIVRPEYYILLTHASQIYQNKDMYLSGNPFSSIEQAYEYREKLQKKEITPLSINTWMSRLKICIKEQSFNNRFEIIERGF